jgi:hypothetical protein
MLCTKVHTEVIFVDFRRLEIDSSHDLLDLPNTAPRTKVGKSAAWILEYLQTLLPADTFWK